MKQRVRGMMILTAIGLLACSCMTTPPPAPPPTVTSELPASVEGEACRRQEGKTSLRKDAKHGKTLLLKAGQQAEYLIQLEEAGDYALVVRYGNDDSDRGDDLIVIANGRRVAAFHANNTRRDNQKPGEGWNEFAESDALILKGLPAGENTIALYIDDADAFGVEIDRLTFSRQP